MEHNTSLHIDDDKKAQLQRMAINRGVLLADYIRMVLNQEIDKEITIAAT